MESKKLTTFLSFMWDGILKNWTYEDYILLGIVIISGIGCALI
jgi:hypothetical protein